MGKYRVRYNEDYWPSLRYRVERKVWWGWKDIAGWESVLRARDYIDYLRTRDYIDYLRTLPKRNKVLYTE